MPFPRISGATNSISNFCPSVPIKAVGRPFSVAITRRETPASACGTNFLISRISLSDKNVWVERTEFSQICNRSVMRADGLSVASNIFMLLL